MTLARKAFEMALAPFETAVEVFKKVHVILSEVQRSEESRKYYYKLDSSIGLTSSGQMKLARKAIEKPLAPFETAVEVFKKVQLIEN